MEFEWDPDKQASNLQKHGIDFVDAALLFERPRVEWRSDRGGERRWQTTGELEGRLITVIYTRREGRLRIISARRARKNERREYRALYD